jgi:hypothetical protein
MITRGREKIASQNDGLCLNGLAETILHYNKFFARESNPIFPQELLLGK